MDACQKVGDSAIATLDFAVRFFYKETHRINNLMFFFRFYRKRKYYVVEVRGFQRYTSRNFDSQIALFFTK